MTLTPKNWNTFQHYKDRKPPWIKLHHGLLDDYAFACLHLASQALAPRLWLLASEYEDGKITASFEEIAFRLHMTVASLIDALKPLVSSGFFVSDSELLAVCKQNAMPEREREEEIQVEKEGERSLRSLARDDHVRRETPKRKSQSTKLPLPDDWQPSPMHFVTAERLKLSREAVEGRAEDMRIWAGSNAIRKANWDMTFHGFLRRAANEGTGNGQGRSRPLQNDSLSVSRAADRLIEKAERGEFSFGPRPSLFPQSGEGSVRLLSKG